MPKTSTMALAAIAAACMSIASSVLAGPLVPNNGAAAAVRQAATGARPFGATQAKVAVLYSPILGIVRSKNVSNVTNPDVGIYCVAPSVSLNLDKIYPSVSVDWGWSSGSSLAAFVRDTAEFTDCGAGELEVMTFDFTGAPAGTVAFLLMVV